MTKSNKLLSYKGYIFDLDGTIYLGNRLLANADQVIKYLLNHNKKIVYLSNKPIESRQDYQNKLNRMGIPVKQEQIVNSSLVTAQTIAQEQTGAYVYLIGEPPLIAELEAAGLKITTDPLKASFLVVAFDRTFHYDKLNDAMIALKNGARYFATNPDKTCPVEGGEIPDCAGMIGAIAGVTDQYPEQICGKPSSVMLSVALQRLNLPAADCLMIGDRLETDIKMGVDLNIDTALVLTGITTREILAEALIQPTYILESVADLITRTTC